MVLLDYCKTKINENIIFHPIMKCRYIYTKTPSRNSLCNIGLIILHMEARNGCILHQRYFVVALAIYDRETTEKLD